jgi:6-phosphofructokinase 1
MTNYDFTVPSLGIAKLNSPIALSKVYGDSIANYVTDDEQVLYHLNYGPEERKEGFSFAHGGTLQKAGPREKIYFNPDHVRAGILTCGGLCPGLNDVIRAVVRTLWHRYGVRTIVGIRYGYNGLLGEIKNSIMELNPDVVDDIHRIGGSVLGSSRGGGDRTSDIVDSIERLNLNQLYVIGGDGTQKGALKIANEILERGLKIAVVGVPKTIDNDLSFIEKSFGFETAVVKATEAVFAAHQEAHSAYNGIGLVKVMGRESGFIAAHTAIASHEVNYVLIPEVPFALEGPNGLFYHLEKRLEKRNHAVILVSEGAGQDLIAEESAKLGTDPSGNKKLGDIGTFLRDKITEHFKSIGMPMSLKYIDPSYIIRSSVAIPSDSMYCSRLGSNAVHAAMAGKTKILVSLVNNHFVYLPIDVAVQTRNTVDPESSLWRDVIDATGMPMQLR